MEKSSVLLNELIVCKQFHRYFNERKYMQALDCLEEASKLASYTEFWWFGEEFSSELEAQYAGYHLVANMIPEQKAVDAFEFLYDEKPIDTNWNLLASYCYIFQCTYEDLAVESVYSSVLGVSLNSWDFWPIAYKLAALNLSPDEYYKRRDEDRQRDSETRLRLYFFGKTWDSLPEKASKALISADREYENARGRRQGIFEDLWQATREILVEVLLKPYNEFCSAQKELKSLAALASAPGEYEDL